MYGNIVMSLRNAKQNFQGTKNSVKPRPVVTKVWVSENAGIATHCSTNENCNPLKNVSSSYSFPTGINQWVHGNDAIWSAVNLAVETWLIMDYEAPGFKRPHLSNVGQVST